MYKFEMTWANLVEQGQGEGLDEGSVYASRVGLTHDDEAEIIHL